MPVDHAQDADSQHARYVAAVRAHDAVIRRLAAGYEADPELRRDLAQEIHLALWRSFATFSDQCSERTWVYRVAHNVAVSHIVHRRRFRLETLVDLDELTAIPAAITTGEAASSADLRSWLQVQIRRLAPVDRQIMLLYLDDLSAADMADITGLSAGAIATRIHRIKTYLGTVMSSGDNP